MRNILSSLPESIKAPLRPVYAGTAWIVGGALWKLGTPWRQLLVCGYPRSGTSLLYNMLAASLPGFTFTDFEQRAEPLIRRPGTIASKTPMDVLTLNQIVAANIWHKELLVVIPLRDIRDVLTSRHPMLPGEYFIGCDYSWWPQPDGSWRYDAPGIQEIHAAIHRAGRLDRLDDAPTNTAPGYRTVLFRYEDLLADADSIQRRLAQELDLQFSSSFSSFHERGDRLAYRYEGEHAARDTSMVLENKPVQADRAGKWRNPEHRDRIRDQFKRFPVLFDILIDDGYEANRAWFDAYL